MSTVNLLDQFTRLELAVQREIDSMREEQPLKGWFHNELKVLRLRDSAAAEMEDVSARMRALRQLEYMVHNHLVDAARAVRPEESLYTMNSRLPGNLLEMVKKTNFSIEPKLLLDGAEPVRLFDQVSPTAKVVGYLRCRGEASLAFAAALSSPEESRAILRDLEIVDDGVQDRMALLFRSRYYCLNAAIARCGVHQVLELASGISPRGLHWSREHPGTVYIESDLPSLIRGKAKVMRNAILEDRVERRGVLHCCGLDALDLGGLRHALDYTDPAAGLAIVTEGLLLYFNEPEMERFLTNMHTVLAERPRARWVADLVSRANMADLFHADPLVAGAVKRVFASTQRAVVADNPFADEAGIQDALRRHGLRIVSQALLSEQAENAQLYPNSSPQEVRLMCGNRKIWTIAAA